MTKETNTIGSRIRECRKELGYSQEQLAEMLYMKKSTICKYEKDLHDIPAGVLSDLAKALKTSPNYLLFGETEGDEWMDEMLEVMEGIQTPELRRLALKQLRCIAEME